MKNTQEKWVKDMLKEHGKVTRNQALGRYITRLASIISDLNNGDWEIAGAWDSNHKDYIYSVVKKPYQPKYVRDEIRNVMVLQRPEPNEKLNRTFGDLLKGL